MADEPKKNDNPAPAEPQAKPAPAQPASSGPGGPQTGASAPAAAAPGAPAGPAGAPAAAAPKPAGPPPMPKPPPLVPFVAQPDRTKVDYGEQSPDGSKPLYADREWIGYAQQGGGKVPEDWFWGDSPKQRQDEEM